MVGTTDFVKGMTPIRIVQPDTGHRVVVCWVDETRRLCRWVVKDRTQRLRKYPAFAKDATVYERIIRHFCDTIEILDETDGMLYRISVPDFEREKWLFQRKSGPQWAVDRRHWQAV